jgi:hypothetical protein
MIGSKACATQLRANWEHVIGVASALAASNTACNYFFSYIQECRQRRKLLLCRSPEQAIAIGLSKRRRVGVKLPVPPTLRSWEDGFSGLISDL